MSSIVLKVSVVILPITKLMAPSKASPFLNKAFNMRKRCEIDVQGGVGGVMNTFCASALVESSFCKSALRTAISLKSAASCFCAFTVKQGIHLQKKKDILA